MRIVSTTDKAQALTELSQVRAGVADRRPLLNIFGVLMVASIAKTFREEGSPAGSWAPLAASTLRKKGYTAGHKLLVLHNRLARSIGFAIDNADSVSVGSRGIPYAAVQNFGSEDHLGGAEGPLQQLASVPEHGSHATKYARYKLVEVVDRFGKKRMMPQPMRFAKGKKTRIDFRVRAHRRAQNIPARPFAVVRPEDPERLRSAAESYFALKAAGKGAA